MQINPQMPDTSAIRAETRLRQASAGFEALFLQQILKSGQAEALSSDLLDSSATRQARAMLDTTLAEQAAGRAGLGLGDAIYRQFAGIAGIGRSGS
jgi:flagellar protein FlgJ